MKLIFNKINFSNNFTIFIVICMILENFTGLHDRDIQKNVEVYGE